MTTPSQSDLSKWRDAVGASGRLWKGPRGRHIAEPGYAMTFSGERGVDYNVAFCHSDDVRTTERALADVGLSGSPGLIMLAGPALGRARVLHDAGWIPVDSLPLMALSLSSGAPDGAVRRLDATGLVALRALSEETFNKPLSEVRLPIPDEAATDAHHPDPSFAGWGLYEGGEMVSGVMTVAEGQCVCVWSMVTPPGRQRHGYGKQLLTGVLAECAAQGAELCLLLASEVGDALYRSMGFIVADHWQIWSRPRWVLA